MLEIRKHFDLGSLVVIAATFILFVLALFYKGLTHDMLLEGAVFLVSVKLIIMAYRSVDASDSLHQKLDEIDKKINAIESHLSRDSNNNT